MTTALWRTEELAVLESRPIWRRSVVLFGRSVPISVLLLIVTAFTALAAWAISAQLDVTLTTVGIGPVTFDTPITSCPTDADPSGVGSTITGTGPFTVAMTSGSLGDRCYWRVTITNDGDDDLYVGALTDDITFGGAFVVDESSCGEVVSGSGGTHIYQVQADVGPDSTPGTAYGPLSVEIPVQIEAPTCP